MSKPSPLPNGSPSALSLLTRILCVVFAVEIIADYFLPVYFPMVPYATTDLGDSLTLIVVCSPFVWWLVVLPISRHLKDRRISTMLPLFAGLVCSMFLIEVLAIQLLPAVHGITGSFIHHLTDAILVTLISAPVFWWTMKFFYRSVPMNRRLGNLPESIVILYQLNIVIFFTELYVMDTIERTFPGASRFDTALIDSSLLCLVCSPFIWWLVVRPLRAAARAERARFDHVVSTVVDAVIISSKYGHIEICNSAAESLFGYGSSELSGVPVQSLIPGIASLLPLSGNGKAREFEQPVEMKGERRDGSNFPLSLTASSADIGTGSIEVLIVRDISSLKKQQEDKERMLALFAATLESTADGILAVDWSRRIQVYNRRFAELFEIPEQILIDGDNRKLVAYLKAMMNDPEAYQARVEELYSNFDAVTTDRLLLVDGRVIERYSQPQLMNGTSVGRVWSFRDITDLLRSEQELRQQEERFRTLATFAPVGIFETDAQGECMFVNQQWCRLSGMRPEDAVGHGWSSALHPEDVERIQNEWYQSVADGRKFEMEYRFRTPDGDVNWVLGNATALYNSSGTKTGYLGIIVDINERRRAEQSLLESEERFRQIFEQSEDAIILFTPGVCSIIDLNPTAESMFGYPKFELNRQLNAIFKDNDDFNNFMHTVCQLEAGHICHLDRLESVRRDGAHIIVSVRAKIIRLQGRETVYCTLRDITERLRMEEEARSIQAQLIHTNKMTSLGLLVAGIAHEINNPNNYILANGQLLAKVWNDLDRIIEEESSRDPYLVLGGLTYPVLKESLPGMFNGIIEGSRRIRDIINNLKNYSRQGSITKESNIDINRVIKATIPLMNHHIKNYTDNFRLELSEGLPSINGSAQQLEQVIVNLVMNSLQALSNRNQEVSISTALSSGGDAVVVCVHDQGSGISSQIIERVTEPFFTTKLDAGGTGLGLSISRSIIESHQGTMTITSTPGEGTTFAITLPVYPKLPVKE